MFSRSVVHRVMVIVAALVLIGGIVLSRGAATEGDELGTLAFGLTLVLGAALAGGHLAARVGQPAVMGELIAGILLGNLPGLERLQFIGADPYLDILARIGMLLLLFEVGVDLSVRDLVAVGRSSLLVALLGTVSSLAAGTAASVWLMRDASFGSQVFVGAAITATSVGITARVLRDMSASRSQEARIILGAAVIDDVLALVVLGVIVAWVTPGPGGPSAPAASIAALIMKTFGFLVIAIVLGTMLTPAWFRQAARLRTEGALLGSGLCFCFLLCWAATALGLSAIVGAFAAGLVLEDAHSALFVERGERPLVELLQPMTSFLVPIFFVLVGFRVNVASLTMPAVLALPLALTVAAVVAKLSCALGVLHRGANRLTVAVGMMPRGEVALVFAALGSTVTAGHAPILNEYGYTAIVTVVIVTTLLTPPALKWSLRARAHAGGVTTPAA